MSNQSSFNYGTHSTMFNMNQSARHQSNQEASGPLCPDCGIRPTGFHNCYAAILIERTLIKKQLVIKNRRHQQDIQSFQIGLEAMRQSTSRAQQKAERKMKEVDQQKKLMAIMRREINEFKQLQEQRAKEAGEVEPIQIPQHVHFCSTCQLHGHCLRCCPKNPERVDFIKECNYCKKHGHDQQCCNKFKAFLQKRQESKVSQEQNRKQQVRRPKCPEDSSSDDEVVPWMNQMAKFNNQKFQQQKQASALNEQIRDRRSQPLNKFNQNVSIKLTKASIHTKFNEELDDDKMIEPEYAIKMMKKVMVVLKEMNMSQEDISMIIVQTPVDTHVQYRDEMESILKQTNGIGSTFYDMDLLKNQTRGLWIVPNDKIDTIKKQEFFTYEKISSRLMFEKKNIPQNQINSSSLVTNENFEFTDELVSIITQYWSKVEDDDKCWADLKTFVQYS